MKKSMLVVPLALVVIAGIAGLYLTKTFSSKGQTANQKKQLTVTDALDVPNDVCETFPLEFINTVTGKRFSLTKTFQSSDKMTSSCEYFEDNHFIIVNFSTMEVAKQRKGYEVLERTITTDPRISIEHFMVHSGKSPEQIIDIYLVFGSHSYVRVGKSSSVVIDNNGLIDLADEIAGVLTGKTTTTLPQKSSLENTQKASPSTSPLPSEQQIGRTFLESIGNKNIDKALSMMSTTLLGDNNGRQTWGVQFNSFEEFSVVTLEDVMKESWSADTQEYKATIRVRMKPSAAQAPIPNYGWDNGENTRWIIMKKVGKDWKIDAISTGP